MARSPYAPTYDPGDDPGWQVSPRRPDGSRPSRGVHVGPLRVTPLRVTLAVALVGSVAFMLYAVTVRDELQVPMLASGAAVLGLVFAAVAVSGAMGMVRAVRGEQGRQAMLYAVGAGVAAIVASGALAAAMIFGLLWKPGG